VACLAHFQGEPLACLAPAAAAGPAALRAAAAALPEPLRASAARRLGLAGRGPAALAAAVAEALAARGRWALALAWTHAAARAVGHRASARPQPPRPCATRGGAPTLQLLEQGSACGMVPAMCTLEACTAHTRAGRRAPTPARPPCSLGFSHVRLIFSSPPLNRR